MNSKTKSKSSKKKSSQPQTHRIPRTRGSNTLTEAQFKARIISLLRNGSRYWKPISECLRGARIGRGKYKCSICGELFSQKEMVVDHINPVVPVSGWVSFDHFIESLYCEIDNLQAICKECHNIKTKKEQDARKLQK